MSYDDGFRDGVLWVHALLLLAAGRVENPTRGTAERDGKVFEVVTATGQPHFAHLLRELARGLREVVNDERL